MLSEPTVTILVGGLLFGWSSTKIKVEFIIICDGAADTINFFHGSGKDRSSIHIAYITIYYLKRRQKAN